MPSPLSRPTSIRLRFSGRVRLRTSLRSINRRPTTCTNHEAVPVADHRCRPRCHDLHQYVCVSLGGCVFGLHFVQSIGDLLPVQTTKQYQSLTIDAVPAVTTYINMFAFLWAGASSDFTSFNQSATYYLYKPGAAAPGPSSAPPNLVGKLSLQKDPNAPSPARVSDTSAVYTCTFTDPSGAT